jgi:multiple sugar transport system ATP-binding protein
MVATFLGNPPMNILPAIYKGDSFDINRQLLALPAYIQENLPLHPGQSVDLGIRPEHISINADATSTHNTGLLVEVKVVEPLGRETLVRVGLPDSTVVLNVQLAGDVRLHPGDRLALQLDLNQLFIFDPKSGQKISPQI